VIVAGALQGGDNLPYTATLTLQGMGDLKYAGSVHLVQNADGTWMVDWTTGTIYPGMVSGEALDRVEGTGGRGDLQDREGRPLSASEQLTGKVAGAVDDGGGASGLNRSLDGDLSGDPGEQIAVVDHGDVVKTLLSSGGSTGKGVRTTLDLDVQAAAEAALAGVPSRAAIVALDLRTGGVLALADVNGGGLPASLLAQEPPGSTFKIVTATAALMNGTSPSTRVSCTTTLSVNGKSFKNHEPNPSRTMTLTDAFADSCNTAFIDLEQDLPDDALLRAADLYGFGIDQPLPVSSEGGHIPAPAGSVEAAADAIGQGRVLASPLQMASVAAGVASGTWRQPRLLSDCDDCRSNRIPNAAALRPMMRAVVTKGTGTVLAGTPGGKVYAKTGTAEFGSGDELHAWLVGWQGNIAFAAYVENGESGGSTAAPLIKKFLTRLAR
jgi:cell division protein FtsI/penicillin-binding protein 2